MTNFLINTLNIFGSIRCVCVHVCADLLVRLDKLMTRFLRTGSYKNKTKNRQLLHRLVWDCHYSSRTTRLSVYQSVSFDRKWLWCHGWLCKTVQVVSHFLKWYLSLNPLYHIPQIQKGTNTFPRQEFESRLFFERDLSGIWLQENRKHSTNRRQQEEK